MGLGMLFAGALAGGAQAVGEIADGAIKQREQDRARSQSLMDRRNELLYEMKLKADMVKQQERDDAMGYQSAQERGKSMGDDRRFAKFREDVRSSGYGEGMSEEGLRDLFNQHYNDKVVAGDPRYYEPESAEKRDALQAARSSGASGKVLSALQDEYKSTEQGERQARQEASREAREERRYQEQRERDLLLFGQRKELQGERLDAQAERSSRGGDGGAASVDQTSKLSVLKDVLAKAEASKPNPKDYRNQKQYEEASRAWAESDSGKAAKTAASLINTILSGAVPQQGSSATGTTSRAGGDVAALQREIAAVERGSDSPRVKSERLQILRSELAKEQSKLAQKSTVRDNSSTVGAAPVEVKTKAAYDALPKGARYVAPDGTVRTKG